MTGKKRPEWVRKKIGESLKSAYHTGKRNKFNRTPSRYWLGKKHSEETRRKMSEARIGKKLSAEIRGKMRLARKGKPNYWLGKKRSPPSEEHRKKISEAKINHPNRKFKETSIELKIESELQKRGINYQKQVPLCKIAIVDFYLPEYRIVIQCDGCYWHGCPIHNPSWTERKQRDKNQDSVLTFNGFNVYRFWQHEIDESAENCIRSIKTLNLN